MDSYRIVGAFDTETTNYGNPLTGLVAYPILYQLGLFDCDIKEIYSNNVKDVVDVFTCRKCTDLYNELNNYLAKARAYVPVILVHNLGFDMYSLAPWLLTKNVRVLAKTARKPISFQVLNDEGKPKLVLLDTLGLYMKSLNTLGEECGMPKLVGSWDYNLVRTLDTELSTQELDYAKGDLYTLIAYTAYFLRQNEDINPGDIGYRVQTKTGVVRSKRMTHVGNIKSKKLKLKVRQYWHIHNQQEKPKTDDELFTMHVATRGGFTFCARNNASKVFHEDKEHVLLSYDSTSQHPAQMVSHLYPQKFKEATAEQLDIAFSTCEAVSCQRLLKYWLKPFPFAFYGAFEFTNLRPKEKTVFAKDGIFSLASARITAKALLYDNQATMEFNENMKVLGYKDEAINAVYAFGKLESADKAILYLTELDAWIVNQIYDYDSVNALHGYLSTTFRKPSDMATLSVMRFYKAKNVLKEFRQVYKEDTHNDVSALAGLYPDSFVKRCEAGKADGAELREYYMLAKADLNSLFGIEATNECRRDFELNDYGLELTGEDGLQNMPRSVKCNYQFGQRIVGWSRVAQTLVMNLIAPYVENIICGDTDSLKIYVRRDNVADIEKALKKHAKALDMAKASVTKRVKTCYSSMYDNLEGIGHYVLDGQYKAFCAGWNKAYIALTDKGCKSTIAGIPSDRRTNEYGSLNDFANELMKQCYTFDEVASLVIGYNVSIDYSITKLNARYHPEHFGALINMDVIDYKGNVSHVLAPHALALYPMLKTLGDTRNKENEINSKIAIKNNPNVNVTPVWLKWRGGKPVIERN